MCPRLTTFSMIPCLASSLKSHDAAIDGKWNRTSQVPSQSQTTSRLAQFCYGNQECSTAGLSYSLYWKLGPRWPKKSFVYRHNEKGKMAI